MPKLSLRQPRYCHHRATGLACCYLGGRVVYLGPYGSPESKREYKRVLADWLSPTTETKSDEAPAGGKHVAVPKSVALSEVIQRFREHAKAYYRESRENHNLRDAIRPLRVMFGKLDANEIRASHLRQVRDEMVKSGLARRTVNDRVNRIRRLFRWAVAEDLVEPMVLERLRALEPLRWGRGGVERAPVKPVNWERVERTLPYLTEMTRAMVLVGWHSGARPGELTSLSTSMIDTAGSVWVARLTRHKNQHRGQIRELLFGPQAQAALTPWLLPKRPDEPIFSPKRIDPRRKRGARKPGREYGRSGLNTAVRRACEKAFVHPELKAILDRPAPDGGYAQIKAWRKARDAEVRTWKRKNRDALREWEGAHYWSPNQLRHAAATRLREQHGIEAAQVALGHAKPDTTLIYSAAAKARAIEAIRLVG
jgi:integrase